MQELPFLIRLLDDTSPLVAQKVEARLRELGKNVWNELERQQIELSPTQQTLLDKFLADSPSDILRAQWLDLQSETNELSYLERSLFALSDWHQGEGSAERGKALLDRLVQDFNAWHGGHDSRELAHFLFEFCGLRGASTDDYYNPLNSDLIFAIEKGVGLPITLACVFILVGNRLGMKIEGCNFPGHFLARDGQRQTIFDPIEKGRVLSMREVATLRKVAPAEMNHSASSREIVARVLRNLSVAYHHNGQRDQSRLMLSLLHITEDN